MACSSWLWGSRPLLYREVEEGRSMPSWLWGFNGFQEPVREVKEGRSMLLFTLYI